MIPRVLTRYLTADEDRLTFVSALADRVKKSKAPEGTEQSAEPVSQDAYVYATVEAASIQLRLEEFDEAKKKLDECEQMLESFDFVETIVHASFYRISAEYHKVGISTTPI